MRAFSLLLYPYIWGYTELGKVIAFIRVRVLHFSKQRPKSYRMVIERPNIGV